MSRLTIWLRKRRHPLPKHAEVGRWTGGIEDGRKIFGCEPDAPFRIGSFCSIADETVFVCSGNHPTDCATTCYIHEKMLGKPNPGGHGGKGGIKIGNDVWSAEEHSFYLE